MSRGPGWFETIQHGFLSEFFTNATQLLAGMADHMKEMTPLDRALTYEVLSRTLDTLKGYQIRDLEQPIPRTVELVRKISVEAALRLEETALVVPLPDVRRYRTAAECWERAAACSTSEERREHYHREAERLTALYERPLSQVPPDARRQVSLGQLADRLGISEANAPEYAAASVATLARLDPKRGLNCQRSVVMINAAFKSDKALKVPERSNVSDFSAQYVRLEELFEWGLGGRFVPIKFEQLPSTLATGGRNAAAIVNMVRQDTERGHLTNLVMYDDQPTVLEGQTGSVVDLERSSVALRNMKLRILVTTHPEPLLDIDHKALAMEIQEIQNSPEFSNENSYWGMTRVAAIAEHVIVAGVAQFIGQPPPPPPNLNRPPVVPGLPPVPKAVAAAIEKFGRDLPHLDWFRRELDQTNLVAARAETSDAAHGLADISELGRPCGSAAKLGKKSASENVKDLAWRMDDKGVLAVVVPGRGDAKHIRRIDGYLTTFDPSTGRLSPGTPEDLSDDAVVVELAGREQVIAAVCNENGIETPGREMSGATFLGTP